MGGGVVVLFKQPISSYSGSSQIQKQERIFKMNPLIVAFIFFKRSLPISNRTAEPSFRLKPFIQESKRNNLISWIRKLHYELLASLGLEGNVKITLKVPSLPPTSNNQQFDLRNGSGHSYHGISCENLGPVEASWPAVSFHCQRVTTHFRPQRALGHFCALVSPPLS